MKTEGDIIEWIQSWFASQCNEEWEHSKGIKIDTIDNPGWMVLIDIEGTYLEKKKMNTISEERNDDEWINCSVSEAQFRGFAGPNQLDEILKVFKSWAARVY